MPKVAEWHVAPGDVACLLFWDLKATFLSLGHDYLWTSVSGVRAPAGMQAAVRRLCSGGRVCWAQGAREHMHDVRSGGCPRVPVVRGLARVCAHDVGAMLRKVRHLARMARVLRSSLAGAGLEVRPDKYTIVPCAGGRTPRQVYRWAIEEVVPEWASSRVPDHSAYLGDVLGPGVERHRWDKPIAKGEERAAEVAQRSPPKRLRLALDDVAALSAPPSDIRDGGRSLVQKLWHLPGDALLGEARAELGWWHCPKLHPVEARMRRKSGGHVELPVA